MNDPVLNLKIAELQIDLKIVKAERDLCILALKELEERHSARYRRANKDESDSVTLRTIRRVLKAVELHGAIAA